MNGLLEWMYNIVTTLGNALMSLLPTSPFRSFIDNWIPNQYLGWLNWFIPVGQILSILALWLGAITLFYIYSIAMRWIKMIGD